MSLPARTDVDPEYRFDLTTIYKTPKEWNVACEQLEEQLADLRSLAEKPISSVADLQTLLDAVADCFRRKSRVELYAQLAKNVDTNSDAAADRTLQADDLAESFEPAVTTALRRIAEAGEYVDSLPQEERRYARNLRKQAHAVRSEEVEEVLAAIERPLDASTRIVRAVRLEDFDPPTVERPVGKPSRYATVTVGPSSRIRSARTAGASTRPTTNAWNATNTPSRGRLPRNCRPRRRRRRHGATTRFATSLQPALLSRNRPPGVATEEVHDVMLDSVRENLCPFHDALQLRKQRLDVDPLRPWDLQASIASADPPELDYDEVVDHILTALEPLGGEYVARAEQFVDERRIDVYPTQDKRTDIPAYCPSSTDDGAYILANFEEDVRTAFFICHEFGHALAVEHQREGPARYATAPRPVEELPSILHELLLVDHFLGEGGALADAARNRLLECVGGNFYGAARSSLFTHEMAGYVEDGEEVTVDRTREVAESIRQEFFEPVKYDDNGVSLPVSGIREPYSNYQYVLGATGALAVHNKFREDDLSPAAYREFLRSTGQKPAVDLFEGLGCDVRTPEPFERAATTFGEHVADFEGGQ